MVNFESKDKVNDLYIEKVRVEGPEPDYHNLVTAKLVEFNLTTDSIMLGFADRLEDEGVTNVQQAEIIIELELYHRKRMERKINYQESLEKSYRDIVKNNKYENKDIRKENGDVLTVFTDTMDDDALESVKQLLSENK